MKNIDKFTETQLKVLELFEELQLIKFSKKKKDIYEEIQKRMKLNKNTIISWINRYYSEYIQVKKEITEEKNAKLCNFEGLTEKQTKYVILRMHGISKEKAKLEAGYSETTKAANIERSPKLMTKMTELREALFLDTELGAYSIVVKLTKIMKDAVDGTEVVEVINESGPDGQKVTRRVRREKPHLAGVAAARELNSMLGYRVVDEVKLKATLNSENDTAVSDDDFE